MRKTLFTLTMVKLSETPKGEPSSKNIAALGPTEDVQQNRRVSSLYGPIWVCLNET
jgi:hypothetical protein